MKTLFSPFISKEFIFSIEIVKDILVANNLNGTIRTARERNQTDLESFRSQVVKKVEHGSSYLEMAI